MNVPFEIGSGRGHACVRMAIRDAKTAKGLYESGVASDY